MVALSGSGWKLAPSLIALIEETDRRSPRRRKTSDGSIGDQAHSARQSDHNPANGWVCAVDITDDKAGGCDADLLARHVVAARDPRVKYVIWNRTIVKSYSSNGKPAWTPYPYTGSNPHDSHTHISVHNTLAGRDDRRAWWSATPSPQEDSDMTPDQDARLKRIEEQLGSNIPQIRSVTDAIYTAGTVQAIKDLLGRPGADVDEEALAEAIAANIPADLAQKVADELAKRLAD